MSAVHPRPAAQEAGAPGTPTPGTPTPGTPAPGTPTPSTAIPGLMEAFWEYERALMENDLPAMDALFAPGSDTMRGDSSGLLVGHEAISGFRGTRGGAPKRRIVATEVRALGPEHAVVVAVTELLSGGRGQQTQVWVRNGGTWQVAVAHVAVSPPAFDRRVWRVVGDPLVPPAAPGILDGETVAVKDLYAVAGQRVGAGSPAHLAQAVPETTTAAAVAALLGAGASVKGMAATDEFAYSLAGTNTHYGTPPNPKAPFRISGGSSSGSASAVSLGHASIGLGTDTGGSVRVPSAYQGLWGIRTTHGAVSTEGLVPLAPSFDTVGWMARTPEVLEAVGRVLLPAAAPAAAFPGLRLVPGLLDLADGDVAAAIRAALDRWEADGPAGRIEPAGPIDPDRHRAWLKAFQAIQGREAWAAHGEWVGRHGDRLAPDVAGRFRLAAACTAEQEAAARQLAAEARAAVRALVGDGILVVPSAASVAPLARDSAAGGEAIERQRQRTLLLTCLAGLAGLPAVNVPLETAEGLPCGVSLVGAAGSDTALLAWAGRLPGAAP
ncbi:hypothetical protein NCCP1664_11050 [Zafaria cholistanensis]|uniref:Amidase domain-containing protein n=1 Tax=Zafaria cholistanensis TaxID=1682741 RepID=A0A5A7NS28_9MICC|nr:AtzH-like domain-containing protein [Zafaria cholistanensis]GER22608.1 hypothetical protein NCCP1664_11050 [Zafaria cholistanensis]